jgi:GNAT superfamily N-acetyltransferase/predicted nucleic acid-binding protein
MEVGTQLKIQTIDHNSEHLKTVMVLGRSNSSRLGQMPDGGFNDYAARRQIIVAVDSNEQCVGYLMYRIVNRQTARIVHLCVDKKRRSQGIARQLVKYLRQQTKDLYGIDLWCRRDYQVNGMWHTLGFVPQNEKPGNNQEGKLLTYWCLSNKVPDLISILVQQKFESKLCAAIDANIFYDLDTDDDLDQESNESKSLLADWLKPELELCLTEEIYNEIYRNENVQERERLREIAETFTRLYCNQEEFEAAQQLIRTLFGRNLTSNERSDFYQLARAIASKSQFFVTRDKKLLALEEQVYIKTKILIIRPTDLIIRLDELRRQTEYQSLRVAGTSISKKRLKSGQQNLVTDCFLAYAKSETKNSFVKRLHKFIAEPERFECYTIWDAQEKPVAIIVYDRQEKHELEVPLLRVKSNRLASTIARHLMLLFISTSAKEGRQFTKITDPYLEDVVIAAIQNDKFVKFENGWLKANLTITGTVSQLSLHLTHLGNTLGEKYNFCLKIADNLKAENAIVKDTQICADIEKTLYPAKIIDSNIPNFIVPIKPIWAEALFDEKLASQSCLSGLESSLELALRRECVYYRSVKNSGGLQAPGRILWYISEDTRSYCNEQVGAIRACFRLDEIIIGKPKNLYKQFRRLGIYTYKDVLGRANNNEEGDVMALKFSDTELFNNPINLADVKLISEGKIAVFSHYRIESKVFEKLYNIGMSTFSN